MRININKNQLLDIINLELGVYNPIKNLMSEENIISVIESYNLNNGTFFPMPVYLSINLDAFNKIKKKNSLTIFYKNMQICNLYIYSIYKLNSKKKIAFKLFNTKDERHPGLNNFLKTGNYFIEGSVFNFNNKILKSLFFSKPSDVMHKIKEKKLKTVAAFHTRNVPHKGHEWIHSYALKFCDGLMIHPLIGQFKKDEYKEKIIIKTNKLLVDKIYSKKKIFLEFLNSYPRYAGPREALFHSLIRKNYGCTHFLVGRDHAGVSDANNKNYYKKYSSQKLCKKYQSKIGIKIISFKEPYFCQLCNKVLNNCNHNSNKIFISGTKIRKNIVNKEKISKNVMRSEISNIISRKDII